jgi:hypothetical protein
MLDRREVVEPHPGRDLRRLGEGEAAAHDELGSLDYGFSMFIRIQLSAMSAAASLQRRVQIAVKGGNLDICKVRQMVHCLLAHHVQLPFPERDARS